MEPVLVAKNLSKNNIIVSPKDAWTVLDKDDNNFIIKKLYTIIIFIII